MDKLRVLDLFSGIGGFSLGLERTGGFKTVAFCEIEEFPRKVLAKHWPDVPCFPDVRKLGRKDIEGPIDVICGGYPCQPYSVAGERGGKGDDRALWGEINRLLDESRPTWFVGENVAGHITLGVDDVLSDLENLEYTARTFVIPACAVNARHRRDRVWIIANSDHARQQPGARAGGDDRNQSRDNVGRLCSHVSNTKRQRGRSWDTKRENASDVGQLARRSGGFARRLGERHIEPAVGRVAHGVPRRVDRLKGLGNAVVPQIPEMIGHAILATYDTKEGSK